MAKNKMAADPDWPCRYLRCPHCHLLHDIADLNLTELVGDWLPHPRAGYSWRPTCVKLKFKLNGGHDQYCLIGVPCSCGSVHLIRDAFPFTCPRCKAKTRIQLSVGVGCDKNNFETCQTLLTYLEEKQKAYMRDFAIMKLQSAKTP